MGKRNRIYTREFKVEALQLLARGGKSAAELERELGITKGMLLKWRDRYRVDERKQSLEPSDLEAARAEVRRLRRELEVTAQERDILKKAVVIFSHKGG
jgi:transposase